MTLSGGGEADSFASLRNDSQKCKGNGKHGKKQIASLRNDSQAATARARQQEQAAIARCKGKSKGKGKSKSRSRKGKGNRKQGQQQEQLQGSFTSFRMTEWVGHDDGEGAVGMVGWAELGR